MEYRADAFKGNGQDYQPDGDEDEGDTQHDHGAEVQLGAAGARLHHLHAQVHREYRGGKITHQHQQGGDAHDGIKASVVGMVDDLE